MHDESLSFENSLQGFPSDANPGAWRLQKLAIRNGEKWAMSDYRPIVVDVRAFETSWPNAVVPPTFRKGRKAGHPRLTELRYAQ